MSQLSNGTTAVWAAVLPAVASPALRFAGTSGTPQTILDTDTITIAAGSNITTTAGSTDTITIANR